MAPPRSARKLGELTNTELAAGRAALAELIGEEASGEVAWLRRLVLVDDRLAPPHWELDVRVADKAYSGEPPEAWGIRFLRKSLEQGVRFVRSGGEEEADRAEAAKEAHRAKSAAEKAAADERQRLYMEQLARAADERRRHYEANEGATWERTPAWARGLILLAMRRGEGDPGLATDLRAVVEPHVGAEKSEVPGPPLPEARWRP
jgi:hypothetical protein